MTKSLGSLEQGWANFEESPIGTHLLGPAQSSLLGAIRSNILNDNLRSFCLAWGIKPGAKGTRILAGKLIELEAREMERMESIQGLSVDLSQAKANSPAGIEERALAVFNSEVMSTPWVVGLVSEDSLADGISAYTLTKAMQVVDARRDRDGSLSVGDRGRYAALQGLQSRYDGILYETVYPPVMERLLGLIRLSTHAGNTAVVAQTPTVHLKDAS